MRGPKTMRTDLVGEFRQRLAQARWRLFRMVATTDEELDTLERHQAGALSGDAATEIVATILSRLEGQERHELDEIAAAQARLETGIFGTCEGCGRSIVLARLRAMPTARSCVDCQKQDEAWPPGGA